MSSPTEHHLLEFINDVTLGASIPGVALTVLLLATIAYLQWNPISRLHLDRVSFRLLIYALVANVIFGSMMWANMKETSPGCSVVGFLGVASPLFSASMFCCVALNLMLVLVYGVNGNKMEKFYILGAVFLCAACTIPTMAAGEFGWYRTNGACWLRDPTPMVQLHWLLGTYSVPTLLMSSIELLSFVNILVFMLRHEIWTRRLRTETMSQYSSDASESGIATFASSLPKHPVVQFRSMILRIALYPLLSCFLSITACVLDVYSVLHPTLTDFNINLRTTNLCIYSFRPLLYVLLAGTDPSFIRAVRSLHQKSCSEPGTQPSWPWTSHSSQTVKTDSDSYELALSELQQKYSRTDGALAASAEQNERRPSTAEEAPAKDELQSQSVAHQI